MKNTRVIEDSFNASFFLLFLTMLSLWAQWASQLVEPKEVGLLMYVLCIVSGAIYLKYAEGGNAAYGRLQEEITPEIKHASIDRSIRSLYKRINQDEQVAVGADHDADRQTQKRMSIGDRQTNASGLDTGLHEIFNKAKVNGGKAGNTKRRRRRSTSRILEMKFARRSTSDEDLHGAVEEHAATLDDITESNNDNTELSSSQALSNSTDVHNLNDYSSTGDRYVSSEQQRRNLEFVDNLIEDRDVAAAYLDDTVATRCTGALSSWPFLNIYWGIVDGSLTTDQGWAETYREALIVLHAHNDLITRASDLSQLVATIKLRAFAMAKDDKRSREAELVAFLKETQPSMQDITVDDLRYVPPTLMVNLMDAYMQYRKTTQALMRIKEAKAQEEERLVAISMKRRQREADLVRLRMQDDAQKKKKLEMERKLQRAIETLRKEQKQKRLAKQW